MTTDTNGRYALWVDQRQPAPVTASDDGWTPKAVTGLSLNGAQANVQDLTVTRLGC